MFLYSITIIRNYRKGNPYFRDRRHVQLKPEIDNFIVKFVFCCTIRAVMSRQKQKWGSPPWEKYIHALLVKIAENIFVDNFHGNKNKRIVAFFRLL